ncbi:MAG: FAD-binding oxidoreductase [Bacteroidetes bacterium]|nr:FAD-binding oxidoreductase [Bacteroidota bacterium]
MKSQHFSYWEINQYFTDIEVVIIGSGIVGLSAAISYKKQFPKAKVLVLERGILPYGASTKNAGFACFGSVSELLSDLKKNDEATVWETVEMRYRGLELLKKRLGEKHMAYEENGGYELFSRQRDFDHCAQHIDTLNQKIKPITGLNHTYSIDKKGIDHFGFAGIKGLILNRKEGQIDTGLMMQNLLKLAAEKGIQILNAVSVKDIKDLGSTCHIETSVGMIRAARVIVATNGFAAELLKLKDVKPARAQVLITKPIKHLKIKGTFHYQEGFYYFRNIHNRLLFGGGRNLDMETETSSQFELNPKIQQHLDQLLKQHILPDTTYEIDHRWCGIMGVGTEKKPIIKHISANVVCAVRMGGMGVAIGSLVGKLAVDTLEGRSL